MVRDVWVVEKDECCEIVLDRVERICVGGFDFSGMSWVWKILNVANLLFCRPIFVAQSFGLRPPQFESWFPPDLVISSRYEFRLRLPFIFFFLPWFWRVGLGRIFIFFEDADCEGRLCGDVFEVCVSGLFDKDSAVQSDVLRSFKLRARRQIAWRSAFGCWKTKMCCVCGPCTKMDLKKWHHVHGLSSHEMGLKGLGIEGDNVIVESAFARNVTCIQKGCVPQWQVNGTHCPVLCKGGPEEGWSVGIFLEIVERWADWRKEGWWFCGALPEVTVVESTSMSGSVEKDIDVLREDWSRRFRVLSEFRYRLVGRRMC